MIDLLFWLGIGLLAALVGAGMARLLGLRLDSSLTRLLLFTALGYLGLAYLVLALGLLGLLRTGPVTSLLVALLLAGLFGGRLLASTLRELGGDMRRAFLASPARLLYWFLLIWALTKLVSALSLPAGLDWDGLAEHLAMAKRWVEAGRIYPLWYDHHSQFPATLQMLYALALLFRGPVAAKLFHFGFGLMALGAVFELTRQHVSAPAAPWAASGGVSASRHPWARRMRRFSHHCRIRLKSTLCHSFLRSRVRPNRVVREGARSLPGWRTSFRSVLRAAR